MQQSVNKSLFLFVEISLTIPNQPLSCPFNIFLIRNSTSNGSHTDKGLSVHKDNNQVLAHTSRCSHYPSPSFIEPSRMIINTLAICCRHLLHKMKWAALFIL